MFEFLLGSTFLPVAMLVAWVMYMNLQIKKQHEERQDDE
jgi:hypothetical protein